MARGFAGFRWTTNTLGPRMAGFTVGANFAVGSVVDEIAEDMEEYAQENAPWEDRTGDAREGLHTTVIHHGFRHEIVLSHTVDYGIWLEIRWGGELAIILPTIEHYGPILMDDLSLAKFDANGELE